MSTIAEFPQDTVVYRKIVQTWLEKAQTKRQVERLADDLVREIEQFIASDDTLLIPRTKLAKENDFLLWRQGYEAEHLDSWLSARREETIAQLTENFRFSLNIKSAGMARRHLLESAWLPIESRLKQRADALLLAYAVRGLALAWVGGHLGEGLGIGQPERTDLGWRVPVVRRRTAEVAGTLLMDKQGNILTTPAEFRASLR